MGDSEMNLEEYRKLHKMTYEELGKVVGLSLSKVYRFAVKKEIPRLDDGLRIVERTDGYVRLKDLIKAEVKEGR